MYLKKNLFNYIAAGVFTFSISLIAAPIISIDTVDFEAGTVYQNEVKSIDHTFKIKNTGDSALVIKQVKASCGCTSVANDSIIQPGQTGKITAAIKTSNLNNGQFHKTVTIFSNAKNNSEYKLSLNGTIKSLIELSKMDIRLTSTDQKIWSDSVTLSTEKKDLMLTEVSFKPYESGTPTAWQTDLKIYPKYTFSKSDKVDKKFSFYTLKIFFVSKDPEPKFGEFIIKTNHPKMPEIKAGGVIDGTK